MSVVTELTAVLPRRPGALADLCQALDDAGVKVLALCVMDTGEYGLARLIADDADKARGALEESGIPCAPARVVALPSGEGSLSLAAVVRGLAERRIRIDYAYAGVPEGGSGLLVLGVSDAQKASDALASLAAPPPSSPPAS